MGVKPRLNVKNKVLNYHKYIYRLNIITGMALIPLEITADDHHIGENTGIIYFKGYRLGYSDSETIAWFPSVNTIIRERVDNPDYKSRRDRR